MKLPKIPARVYSALGPIGVSYLTPKKARKLGLCGRYEFTTRSIQLNPGMVLESEWVTLWHEIMHVALMDAGVSRNALTKEQEEVVCDAVGSFLTGMMLNGSLKVTSLGTRKATMQ